MKKLIFSLIATFLILSCVSQSKLYYWGEYSDTLYDYKKSLTSETLEKHKDELNNIIVKSHRLRKNVPPGVNAELGYILMLEGNSDAALQYFEQEKSLYPESEKFVSSIINDIKSKD